MFNRTVVAPHLHWKARMLDGAYKGMEDFKRYDPNLLGGDALKPYAPDRTTASGQIGNLVSAPPAVAGDPDFDYRYGYYKVPDPYNAAGMAAYDPVANPVIPF